MKLLLVLFSCALISMSSVAQTAVASSDRYNILLVGIENPISIAVESTSDKNISVRASKGSVEKISEGKYLYRGYEYGHVEIIILKNVNGKLKEVRRIPFRVQPFPDPVPFVGNSKGGSITKKLLIAMGGVIARFENTDFEAPVRVESYTVCVVSVERCEFKTFSNKGNRFSEEVVKAFQALHNNDTIIIKNISVLLPDGKKKQIAPLFFTIEEEATRIE